MKPNCNIIKRKRIPSTFHFVTLIVVLCLTLTACSMPTGSNSDDNQATDLAFRETQIAFDSQNTMVAENNQATQYALAATQAAIGMEATQDSLSSTQIALDNHATQMAIDNQATQKAMVQTQATQPTQPNQIQPPAANPQASFPNFDTWMRNEASILLFEDMAGAKDVYTYIDRTLQGMGLDFVDLDDKLGDFKEQILSGGPNGTGWDLIISGKELRTGVQGEFYVYLNDALLNGTSVIIEEWDMDEIVSGKLSVILNRCGVEYYRDWIAPPCECVPLKKQLLFPINGNHPIHHVPNEGISLTDPSMYWACLDLGDLMQIAPGSDAIPLWGALSNNTSVQLTAVVCMDGQLIIQTYSTHSYSEKRTNMMWENYIYNALKARYDFLTSP